MPLWEVARSGHVDIVAIAFLMLAFLARERRFPLLAGAALGVGVLVKYFPAIAGPALYKRWDWRLPTAFVATVALLYVPYIGAGAKVLGFLDGYFSEEKIDQGSGIFLWQLLAAVMPLREQALVFYLVAAAMIMIGLALFVIVRKHRPGDDLAGAMLLAVTFTILFSPHYAWYFVWLVPFLCFCPIVAVIYLTCSVGYLYFAHWPPTVSEGLVIYGPCVLLFIAQFAFRRRRKREERHADAVPA